MQKPSPNLAAQGLSQGMGPGASPEGDSPVGESSDVEKHLVHLQIAEQGKVQALRGDHKQALSHYRDAMHQAVSSGAPEVFFRHYLEASLESLELMGDTQSVLDYCQKALAHYEEHPPPHRLAELDMASVYQRKGVVLLKSGRTKEATQSFAMALSQAAQIGVRLDLTEILSRWLRRGLTVPLERIVSEQKRLKYFSVRPDTLLPRKVGSGGGR